MADALTYQEAIEQLRPIAKRVASLSERAGDGERELHGLSVVLCCLMGAFDDLAMGDRRAFVGLVVQCGMFSARMVAMQNQVEGAKDYVH